MAYQNPIQLMGTGDKSFQQWLANIWQKPGIWDPSQYGYIQNKYSPPYLMNPQIGLMGTASLANILESQGRTDPRLMNQQTASIDAATGAIRARDLGRCRSDGTLQSPQKGRRLHLPDCRRGHEVSRQFPHQPDVRPAGDFQVDKDGAGYANLSTLPTVDPARTATIKITLSATEMNADVVTIVDKDQTDPPEWADFVLSIPTTSA